MRKGRCFAALSALLVATSAYSFDGPTAAARIGSLLKDSGLPEAPAALSKTLVQPSPTPQPQALFAPDSWNALAAPDSGVLAKLKARYPGLAQDQVREMPYDAIDRIMAAAVARGLTGLDVFSDSGLRGPRVYYLSGDTLAKLFKKYELRALTMPEGVDVDGKPFRMDGTLAGGGKVVMLYDRGFHFASPYYTDFLYFSGPQVTYTIRADADLDIEGLRVDAMDGHVFGIPVTVHPKITRARKTSPGQMFVYTAWGDRTKPLWPIQVRP